MKGVFHLPEDWVLVNRAGPTMDVAPTAYRRDSRVEVFSDSLDWQAFESQLIGCILSAEVHT